VEELGGWLRSLVRSAPEPDAGSHLVAAPPADPKRLPIKRRKGELVRRRRAGLPATGPHGRHKRARIEQREHSPRRLGRTLVLLVVAVMVGGFVYAAKFMPKTGSEAEAGRGGSVSEASQAPPESAGPRNSGEPSTAGTTPDRSDSPSKEPSSSAGNDTHPNLPSGFTLRDDPSGFHIAVPEGWTRTPRNGIGQVIWSSGDFELIVVPGRDSTGKYGTDPMSYQREDEPELQPFRDSTWATSSGMRRIEVGKQVRAEGQFTWTDNSGRELFVRNLAILTGGHYHVVQVRGPDAERDEVTRIWEQASSTYQFGG
jgi:hypothetical protein